MLDSIVKTIPKPPGLSERAQRLDLLAKVLDGALYDSLQYEFGDEQNGTGEYVPLKQRKPSIRYNLCRMVVEDSVSMLFGEGRFPTIDCADDRTKATIKDIIDESNLTEVMVDAATRGSVGSVAIFLRVLKGRVFWQAMPTLALTPVWDPEEPDSLKSITERYQVKGSDLAAQGYEIPEEQGTQTYWFQRIWDSLSETWFLPLSLDDERDGKPQLVDKDRTVQHGLGFVPAVWIRNLPGGDDIDGACTFALGIETQIEIEYRLSQGGRALHYASDPLMMIREPAGDPDGDMVRSASNAIIVSKDGDAKMLEINGASTSAIIDYSRALRDLALETMHGNRSTPEKLAAAQSGRAMELLYQPLINLVDKLRHSYGRGVQRLLRMVVLANARSPLKAYDEPIARGTLSTKNRLTLVWGPYFPATIHDKQLMGQTLGGLKRDGLISRETAVERVVEFEDVADIKAEMARIQADIAAQDARLATQPGVQFKANAQEEQ
nr:phage portal protein [uncultured Lichenicoccus sp.]